MKSVRKPVFSRLLRADSSRNPGRHLSIHSDNKRFCLVQVLHIELCHVLKYKAFFKKALK